MGQTKLPATKRHQLIRAATDFRDLHRRQLRSNEQILHLSRIRFVLQRLDLRCRGYLRSLHRSIVERNSRTGNYYFCNSLQSLCLNTAWTDNGRRSDVWIQTSAVRFASSFDMLTVQTAFELL